MKIRSDIRAGDALSNCQRERDYWKGMAQRMERIANGPAPIPNPTPNPNPPSPGGGWVSGVWYSDKSGWCG